jgi:hypothetical protein
LQYWGFNSGPTPWATLPAFFVLSIFEIGSLNYLRGPGFELRSSWFLPPE